MIDDAETIFDGALRLPENQRAALAARLIESLDESSDADAQSAWETEIQKRLAELDQGTVKSVPWTEARRLIVGSSNGAG